MTHQRYNYLQTVATPRPGVYKILLHLPTGPRNIGLIDFNQSTYYTQRNAGHLHRKSQALAINAEVVKRFKVAWVCVQYCGQVLWTTAQNLLSKGFILTFRRQGFEPQLFLKLVEWEKHKAPRPDSQGDLFEAA